MCVVFGAVLAIASALVIARARASVRARMRAVVLSAVFAWRGVVAGNSYV